VKVLVGGQGTPKDPFWILIYGSFFFHEFNKNGDVLLSLIKFSFLSLLPPHFQKKETENTSLMRVVGASLVPSSSWF